jgi:hypothetical protein
VISILNRVNINIKAYIAHCGRMSNCLTQLLGYHYNFYEGAAEAMDTSLSHPVKTKRSEIEAIAPK